MKKVKAIERNAKGEIIRVNLDSDAANGDWIRAARLKKKGETGKLRKLHDTPAFEVDDNSDNEPN